MAYDIKGMKMNVLGEAVNVYCRIGRACEKTDTLLEEEITMNVLISLLEEDTGSREEFLKYFAAYYTLVGIAENLKYRGGMSESEQKEYEEE